MFGCEQSCLGLFIRGFFPQPENAVTDCFGSLEIGEAPKNSVPRDINATDMRRAVSELTLSPSPARKKCQPIPIKQQGRSSPLTDRSDSANDSYVQQCYMRELMILRMRDRIIKHRLERNQLNGG